MSSENIRSLTEARRSKLSLLGALLPELSAASAETLEIMADVNQVSELLCSLDESRRGQIVSFDAAFGDL